MLLSVKRQDETQGDEPERTRKSAPAKRRVRRFRIWRHERPFAGGVLVAIAGVEMFFSGQLDIGRLHVQMGIEGLQATVIPVMLVLLGVLAIMMPAHHIFYGVIALAVGVYAIVGVNLGGFLIGTILACIGGVLVVAWMTPEARARAKERMVLMSDDDVQRAESAAGESA
ncbi:MULTISPECIES: DUF6114 domain-containing protein [Microbacterium]|uniref:DUF6114 domain-containing protein n=1 Tax=Microbacterium profundi TaxID=450380 RepID=A0ABV3LEM8_9MICO|nr:MULTISPECIES: DUF6114 domain-containing protein [Microbacterium]MCE7483661.1 DUF6114 domain-containing protein [Microbacterium profundi]